VSVPVIGADELARLLPMDAAVEALDAAFGSERLPVAPLRTRIETAAGELLLMPATGPQGAGVKLVTLTGSNLARGLPFVQAAYVLFDPETQEPVAMLEGASLTALRTGAVSALATRYLALADAHRLVIFGAGVQARSHLHAMRAVRGIDEVRVVSRTPQSASALVDEAIAGGLRAALAGPESVGNADLICTCTTSESPVFDGSLLQPGTHVNAVGAYTGTMRELDTQTVRMAKVVVETREAAMSEAGDLLIAIEEGSVTEHHVVADLAELVRGARVRTSSEDVTLFKSVGVAFEDLIVARAVVDRL
jgi:ornithine cyclodeaminase/alanine dehydrogenase-like protein (mu-crystallin family)